MRGERSSMMVPMVTGNQDSIRMAVGEYVARNIDIGHPEGGNVFSRKVIFSDSKYMGEIASAMEVLTRVDLDLAYSSEKLLNLESLLMNLSAWAIDFEAVAAENDGISGDCTEKALTFDLLNTILDSEVRELNTSMGVLEALIVDARHKISSCGHLSDLLTVVEGKLHDSEASLKQSQEHVLEMSMQLAKLQLTSFASNYNDWNYNRSIGLSRHFQVLDVGAKSQMQMLEPRHILRMLEKSLARELDFEKKLTESKQNEDDLKLKLRLTEQVALCTKEAAEVVWERFLESENAAEVLMGISKELVGRLQVFQLNLNGSAQREDRMKSILQEFTEQLKAKETNIQNLNNSNAQLIADNSEVSTLREKVDFLEEQLRESESTLKKSNAANEESEDQLREMDSIIESLKENIHAEVSRAKSAEAKITQLTEINMELTEELGFLKGSNDSNAKKASLLEKQLRELEPQLQYSRASSEASHEQQNMLYSAIWDMETLIDELKQNVTKAEGKFENAEEQCLILSETNLDLNKELDFLRARIECLETSLNQANSDKISRAEHITIKTNLIMKMVTQVTVERDRIQKQLYSLTEENRILMEKLHKSKKDASIRIDDSGGNADECFPSSKLDSTSDICKVSKELATEPSSQSFQMEELSKDKPACVTEFASSPPANNSTNLVLELEAEDVVEAAQTTQFYIYMAVVVLLLSMLATYLSNTKHSP